MKRVGLTQRAHAVAGYSERRDMLDQRWSVLIERLGACPLALSNRIGDVAAYLGALELDALVLTGGNDIASLPDVRDGAPERDLFEAHAYQYFVRTKKPVLGVCRGAQMINHLCGGSLVQIQGHAGCRHELVWSRHLPPYWDCSAEVNSYHDWAIPADGLAPGMQAVAWAADGTVEAFFSREQAVHAILWHPEREPDLAPAGLAFLSVALGL